MWACVCVLCMNELFENSHKLTQLSTGYYVVLHSRFELIFKLLGTYKLWAV